MSKSKKKRIIEPEIRKFRKKTSLLTHEGITYVDYKDVNLLRKFMSERAKIRQRRVTGNSQKQQREVARAIRIAREMALLPYNVRQVTSKSKKRRERDEDTTLADPNEIVEPKKKKALDPVDAEAKEMIEAQSVAAVEEA